MKRYLYLKLLLIGGLFLANSSCEETLISPKAQEDPVAVFESFWKAFDTHYGLFEVKNIQWDDIYEEFRPQVSPESTDEELYNIFSEMIVLFNDNHLNLYPTNGELEVFPGGILSYRDGVLKIQKVQEDFAWDVVEEYLTTSTMLNENLRYGILPNNIGYINITGHGQSIKQNEKFFDTILSNIENTDGLIIDIRADYGGMDAVAQYMAGRFATSEKLYMTTRKRNGIDHSQFTATLEWKVKPTGEFQYSKPIVVLTSNFTQSAGETFLMALNHYDHVTIIGDTTAGSLSDNPNFELPNGWIFSISVGDYRASDGTSYEGVGISPDIHIRNYKEDLISKKDHTLEKALEFLM